MATKISIIPRRDYILVDAPAPARGGPRREIRARSISEAYRIAGDIAAIEVLEGFRDVEIHDEKGNIYLPHEFSRSHPKARMKKELKRPSNPHIRLGMSGGTRGTPVLKGSAKLPGWFSTSMPWRFHRSSHTYALSHGDLDFQVKPWFSAGSRVGFQAAVDDGYSRRRWIDDNGRISDKPFLFNTAANAGKSVEMFVDRHEQKEGRAGGIFHVVYEVRSGVTSRSHGVLEGVFKSGRTAREYANALESVGAKDVAVLPYDARGAKERHARELAERARTRFTHRAGYSRGRVNREGLSWVEWLHAAGYETGSGPMHDRLYLAWVTAQDPSEYRQGAPKRRHAHHASGRAIGRKAGDWFDEKIARIHRGARKAQAKARATRIKAKSAVREARESAKSKVVEHACNICDAGRGKHIKGSR